MMKTEPSIFTRIINGEIPCYKVYEDEKTFAFLDIHPVTDGHVLVVPKVQIDHIWDLNDDDYSALMTTVKKIGQLLKSKLQTSRVGIKVIGLDVPHCHVQLIPFDTAEEYNKTVSMSDPIDHQKLQEVQLVIMS